MPILIAPTFKSGLIGAKTSRALAQKLAAKAVLLMNSFHELKLVANRKIFYPDSRSSPNESGQAGMTVFIL